MTRTWGSLGKEIWKITYQYDFSEDIKIGNITFSRAFDENGKIMYPIKVENITKNDNRKKQTSSRSWGLID